MASVAEIQSRDGLSIGRVFERALSTIRHNPVLLIVLALLFGTLPTLASTYASDILSNQTESLTTRLVVLLLFSLALSSLIWAFAQGVLTRAVVAESEGRQPAMGECIRAAMLVLLPMIGLSILFSLAVGLGLLLFIVPGLMLLAAWYVAVPALVEERQGIFAAFQRSADLTDGARWPIFGLFLVMAVTYLAQEWLITATAGETDSASLAGLFSNPWHLFLNASLTTLLNVLWLTVQASLYVELRNWKDGPATGRLEQIFS